MGPVLCLWLFIKASLLERLITRKFLPCGTKYLRVFVFFAVFSSDPQNKEKVQRKTFPQKISSQTFVVLFLSRPISIKCKELVMENLTGRFSNPETAVHFKVRLRIWRWRRSSLILEWNLKESASDYTRSNASRTGDVIIIEWHWLPRFTSMYVVSLVDDMKFIKKGKSCNSNKTQLPENLKN